MEDNKSIFSSVSCKLKLYPPEKKSLDFTLYQFSNK